jgi:flagellin-like hook-associated protein FlgL
MSSGVTLSAGVRANLLSLQDTANMMQTTQNRLATGKKVNSALDNPLNFFTSSSLSSRASDLSGLLDSMSNGLQTIQTANNGLTAITSLMQQLQATVSQARSDATGATVSGGGVVTSATSNTSNATNNKVTFGIGGGISVDVATYTGATASTLTGNGASAGLSNIQGGAIDITTSNVYGGAAIQVTLANSDSLAATATKINAAILAADSTNASELVASVAGGKLTITNKDGNSVNIQDHTGNNNGTTLALGYTSLINQTSTNGVVGATQSIDQLVTAINANTDLAGKVQASKVANALVLTNLTTTAISVAGAKTGTLSGNVTDTSTLTAGTGGGISSVRTSLMNQFNSLRTQIDKVASDSGYNGINLLNGDDLKLNFNENGTSSIDIQAQDATGAKFVVNSANLGVASGTTTQFADNTQLDTLSGNLSTSLTTLRTQASSLGSSLSVVQTRQDFTKAMINSLQTGADNLVLADSNQEGANLLALQTRQSLSTTALSLSAQADKNVLQLFQ